MQNSTQLRTLCYAYDYFRAWKLFKHKLSGPDLDKLTARLVQAVKGENKHS